MYYAQVAQVAQPSARDVMVKTRLIQKSIFSVESARDEFEKKSDSQVPLVLIPRPRFICSCCMTVPTGPLSILHRCGKDILNGGEPNNNKLASNGCQIAPAWNRIAYCVNQHSITYNAPVKSCPTSDNVMVDSDISIVFSIGPEAADVKKFCYELGAKRFDEFLYAAVEEAIRHLIRASPHTDVYELRGTGDPRVQMTLQELRKKFVRFGVKFTSISIQDVRFKPTLQQTLQETTNFKTRIKEQVKKQKNLMDEIKFRRDRELQELNQQNTRVIQDLQAYRTRVEIDRKKKEVDALSRSEVAITNSKQSASVNETRAASEKTVAENEGLKNKETIIAIAQSKAAEMKIKVDQEVANAIYEAEQAFAAAQNEAEAIRVEAAAEQIAKEKLSAKREHDLQMMKLDAMCKMASTSRVIVSGAVGDSIIQEVANRDILNDIKLKV